MKIVDMVNVNWKSPNCLSNAGIPMSQIRINRKVGND